VVWAVVLAVVLSPLHASVARRLRGRAWLASILIVLVGILVLVVPTALLMDSFGSSVKGLVDAVQNNTIEIPAPGESVRDCPIVGDKIYAVWSKAPPALPSLVQSLQ